MRRLLYVNQLTLLTSANPRFRELIEEKTNLKVPFADARFAETVPRPIGETTDMDGFLYGFSYSTLLDIKYNDGVFLNPMMSGIHIDFQLWKSLLDGIKVDFMAEYVDIAYDEFVELSGGKPMRNIEKNDYEGLSQWTAGMVQELNNMQSGSIH